ncbi:MAG: RNA-directed DNA polymerase [Proteobacteria bacterium]|nr:RNA-directed DNA polymerase [Pseudomonadota bacterium]
MLRFFDIRRYFDSIDHIILGRILHKKIKDKSLLRLLDQIVSGPELPGQTPGKGLPIGNLTSQYFANLYLGELDQYLKSQSGVKGYIRYMDDMLVFSEEKPRLDELREIIVDFLKDRLALELKEKATRLAPVSDGIPWLGVRVFPGVVRLQRERWRRFQNKYRQRESAYRAGKLTKERFLNSIDGLLEQTRWTDSLGLRRRYFERENEGFSSHELDFI